MNLLHLQKCQTNFHNYCYQFRCFDNFSEVLTEAEYLSVDPYMRAYMIGYKLPTDMIGGQVAKLVY